MFHIYCPCCEEYREEEEFHAHGQAHLARPVDADSCTDQEWGEFLYFRENPRGIHRELWHHVAGCHRFFNILRDTQTYRIVGSYRVGEWLEPDVNSDGGVPSVDR